MSRALPVLVLLALISVVGCQASFDLPGNERALGLRYPDGFVATFPHLNPGDEVTVAAQVTTFDDVPVKDIEIIWDDGFYPVRVAPQRSFTDNSGVVTATWVMRPLPTGTFSQLQTVRAYLPGGDHSPLEYTALVVTCTRCNDNAPPGVTPPLE